MTSPSIKHFPLMLLSVCAFWADVEHKQRKRTYLEETLHSGRDFQVLNLKTEGKELTGLIRDLQSYDLIGLFLLADLALLFIKQGKEFMQLPKLLPSLLVLISSLLESS